MSAQDLFGVVVRAVGLFCVVRGLDHLSGAFMPSVGWAPLDYITLAMGTLGLGLVILAAANPIVALAYRVRVDRDSSDAGRGPGVWTGPASGNKGISDSN